MIKVLFETTQYTNKGEYLQSTDKLFFFVSHSFHKRYFIIDQQIARHYVQYS